MAYYNNNQQYNQNANYGNQYHHDQNYDYNNQYDHSGYDAYAQQPGGAYQQQQQQQYNQQQQYQQQPQQGYYDAPASATPSTRAADLPTYNNNNNNADLVPKTNWDEKKRADAGPFANNDASSFVAVKRRRCYPHRPVHWIITACVVALMVGLGVFAFFYWPAFPEITVNYINEYSGMNASAFSFRLDPKYNGNLNKLEIKLNLKMNMSVYNRNPYDLKVELIDLKAFLNINETQVKIGQQPKDLDQLAGLVGPAPVGRDPKYVPSFNPQLGNGTLTSVTFPARTNKTFEMDFSLFYSPDPQLGLLEDPTFKEFCDVCGITLDTVKNRAAKVSYSAQSTVSFLKSFGYKPDISGQIQIRCPIRGDYLENLFAYSAANPNATASEIIQNVFNTTISS